MTENNEAAEIVITDVDTDVRLIIARAYRWGDDYGYLSSVRDAAMFAGYGDIWPQPGKPFTVDVAELISAAFPEGKINFRATVYGDGPDRYDASNSVANTINDAFTNKIMNAMQIGELASVASEDAGDRVDVMALTDQYGSYGNRSATLPVASDDVKAHRKELVTKFLQWADSRGLCEQVEKCLRSVGLGEYLPPQYGDVTVNVPGFGEITRSGIRLDRLGNVSKSYVAGLIAELLAELAHDAKNGASVTIVPEQS